MWCPRTESNRGPIDYKSIALPAELQGHNFLRSIFSRKDQLNQSKKVKLIEAKHLKTLLICVPRLSLVRALLKFIIHNFKFMLF